MKRYGNRIQQYQHNRLFENNQKRFYQDIQRRNETPNGEEFQNFWEEIWRRATTHNSSAEWIKRIDKMERETKQSEMNRHKERLKVFLKKLLNWKTQGPDGVHGFQIKNLSAFNNKLVKYMDEWLETRDMLDWMTSGRTVLRQKDVAKGRAVGSYRPIICLTIV